MCQFFRVKNVVLTRCQCAQLPCVYAHTRMISRSCNPCQILVDYGNAKQIGKVGGGMGGGRERIEMGMGRGDKERMQGAGGVNL